MLQCVLRDSKSRKASKNVVGLGVSIFISASSDSLFDFDDLTILMPLVTQIGNSLSHVTFVEIYQWGNFDSCSFLISTF